MVKVVSLFIASASVVVGSFLINRAAHASTLIWNDSAPSAPIECSFSPTDDSEPLSCSRFKLSRTDNQFVADASGSTVTTPANVNQYTFETNSHINSGVSVNPGDVVTIEASGSIRFGFFAGSGGPRGIFFNPDYNYFVNLPHGHLIGRVRQFGMGEFDGWFSIGEGIEFVVQDQGILEFAVNDNQPSDNTGSFQINVTIDFGQN